MEKILIIGNGFDIAHGLPTRYGDFLEFLTVFDLLYDTYAMHGRLLKESEFDQASSDYRNSKWMSILHGVFVGGKYVLSTSEDIKVTDSKLEKLYNLIEGNIWYEYFSELYKEKKMKGLNWIDFESEMSDVIQWIDSVSLQLEDDYDTVVNNLYAKVVDEKKNSFYEMIEKHCTADYYEAFIDELYAELEDLIKALDIYLSVIVEKLPIAQKDIISDINPDFVISFNYTHTFHKLYNQQIPICYIHGECGSENNTNIVLGIDEYLYGNDRDEHTNMSIFKKFIQRIRNRNDIVYKSWIDSWDKQYKDYLEKERTVFNQPSKPEFQVYVYGHSLGVTDKDILYNYLFPEYTESIIYSYGKSEEGKLISRLIKIIGEDRLIEKSSCIPRKLMFEDCSK